MLLWLISVAIAFNALAYIPQISWFSIIAFVLSISTWVLSRKMYKLDNSNKSTLIIMILSIISTFLALFGIVYCFVMGSIFIGGMSLFLTG